MICEVLERGKISPSKEYILDKIKKRLGSKKKYLHIVSLNPEILVIAFFDKDFLEIIRKAQILIVDGIGVYLALRFLYRKKIERIPGVDLFSELIEYAGKSGFRVLFIGGRDKLAEGLSDCYNRRLGKNFSRGIEGFFSIKDPKKEEETKILNIVFDFKPHFIFVAYGSPFQEKWIEKNREFFENSIVMGVGGGFDYLSGRVKRPPLFVRRLGLEWLYRLIIQPWRIKRQWRLIVFVFLVLGCFLKGIFNRLIKD